MTWLRKIIEHRITYAWHNQSRWLVLLRPLSYLYSVLFRINFYRQTTQKGLLTLTTPCIIVGNISVGGTGKTSVTATLANLLVNHGYSVAIISKGYGRTKRQPKPVQVDAIEVEKYGDEPSLLYMQVNCPVIVCDDRLLALQKWQDKVDVLICDDGLQDYRFIHDYEIALVDGSIGFGSCRLLPEGFLREPIVRLDSCDLVLQLGNNVELNYPSFNYKATACCQIISDTPISIDCGVKLWQKVTIEAYAGLANNARFFLFLRELGFCCNEHSLPDHYLYKDNDFDNDNVKIMTAKDAVKCYRFADSTFWYLQVEIKLDNVIEERILADMEKIIQCKDNGLAS